MKFGMVFDFDGVVIDSSAAHERSWELLAAEEGLELPEGHFVRGFGRKNAVIIPEILGWTADEAKVERLGLRKEELYREIIGKVGIEVLPGVESLLRGLSEAGVPCVIGSSTVRLNIETALAMTGLGDYFRAIVASEDVVHGKPNPEVFIKAAAHTGHAPQSCFVIEDSLAGIEAGRNGGFTVIGVATTHPLENLGRAHHAVQRLTEVSVATLSTWLSEPAVGCRGKI